MYPVEHCGKLGFIDCNGKIIIPIIYDREFVLNDTLWMTGNYEYLDLKKNGLCGLIKHDGTSVIDFCWSAMELHKLNENLLPVAINNKWGFVNVKTGKAQIEPKYDKVEFFQNGLAPVCVNGKWGMIDAKGDMLVSYKYLLEFRFEGEFAVVFEGGSWNYEWIYKSVSNSNCKIIDKKGYEIVSDCSSIKRTGIDVFSLEKNENGKIVKKIKQLIAFSDYIIVIDDGKYLEGYITSDGKYSKEIKYDSKSGEWEDYYPHAKYIGGGTFSVIDYNGKGIKIPDQRLYEIKESLIHG